MQLSKQKALAAIEDWDEIDDTITDTHRWYAIHTVILQNLDGKYYRVNVAYGLTEDQEIEPFSDDSVCFEEVKQRNAVVACWVPITDTLLDTCGMYDVHTNPEGNLTVGDFKLCRSGADKLWIQNTADGDGGEFPNADLEKLIKQYYDEHL